MLTERLLVSIGEAHNKPSTSVAKDASIFEYELQPHATQRTVFKKSATPKNCLAVNASHIFAAQTDKAVVNVYNREKGNQEALIPFKERITCLALACDDTLLVLGSENGRIYLWELLSGRLVTTSQAHLQEVTVIAVEPASNFFLSGSADSSVHVWSIPALLSFSALPQSAQHTQSAPVHTLSGHRDAVTALVVGHGSSFCNIAVSASKDNSCIVWDYQHNKVLRTVLLPSTPLCLALDPADRALYCGHDDGSIQFVNFYDLHIQATAPIQPDPMHRWQAPEELQGAMTISTSYDGVKLISGHASGRIAVWDIPTARFVSQLASPPLPGSATNVQMLPIAGLANQQRAKIRQHAVVKPRFNEFEQSSGQIPARYNLTSQLVGDSSEDRPSSLDMDGQYDFKTMLSASSFPQSVLDAAIADLDAPHSHHDSSTTNGKGVNDDFMALDPSTTAATNGETNSSTDLDLKKHNAQMKYQIASLRRLQKVTFEQMESLKRANQELQSQASKKMEKQSSSTRESQRKELDDAEKGWAALGRQGQHSNDVKKKRRRVAEEG